MHTYIYIHVNLFYIYLTYFRVANSALLLSSTLVSSFCIDAVLTLSNVINGPFRIHTHTHTCHQNMGTHSPVQRIVAETKRSLFYYGGVDTDFLCD